MCRSSNMSMAILTFNSLFEMLVKLVHMVSEAVELTFNSLFEMPQYGVGLDSIETLNDIFQFSI